MTQVLITCRLLVTDGIKTVLASLTLLEEVLLSWLTLVLLIEDFAEALRHQVGPLCTPIVPLKILHWKQDEIKAALNEGNRNHSNSFFMTDRFIVETFTHNMQRNTTRATI